MLRDKLTVGVVKNGLGYRYWTRLNGKMTFGPTRATYQQADSDRVAAIAGNPPRAMSRTERRKAGLCVDCYDPAVNGTCRCALHLQADRDKGERKRRQLGITPREQYLREPPPPRTKRAAAPKPPEGAAVPKPARCRCGLLLPCYHASLEEVAGTRTEAMWW